MKKFLILVACTLFFSGLFHAVLGQESKRPTEVAVPIAEKPTYEEPPLANEVAYTSKRYQVEEIPNPKSKGQDYFISNPDGVLSTSTVAELNRISVKIEQLTGAEFAIVAVNDFVNEDDFGFALKLFNAWGIGKTKANNGLLLFIAKDQHRYRFISGSGIEGIFTDYYLGEIGEKFLVPHFKNDDYDAGILAASSAIEKIFLAPDAKAELEKMLPEAVPFWNVNNTYLKKSLSILGISLLLYIYIYLVEGILTRKKTLHKSNKKLRTKFAPLFQGMGCLILLMFFSIFIFAFVFDNLAKVYQAKNVPYFVLVLCLLILSIKISGSRKFIASSFGRDREEQQKKLKHWRNLLLLPILVSPLEWLSIWKLERRFYKERNRFIPPDDNGDWHRINRNDIPLKPGAYLDAGQLKEESIKSLRYEIWTNSLTGAAKLIPWERNRKYTSCPHCGYFTYRTDYTKTIVSATYSSAGEGKRYAKCANCGYEKSLGHFTIPRKVRSSSSSSSSGGRSSSGGSSSSGSFGGGSSSGGGAGGRW